MCDTLMMMSSIDNINSYGWTGLLVKDGKHISYSSSFAVQNQTIGDIHKYLLISQKNTHKNHIKTIIITSLYTPLEEACSACSQHKNTLINMKEVTN